MNHTPNVKSMNEIFHRDAPCKTKLKNRNVFKKLHTSENVISSGFECKERVDEFHVDWKIVFFFWFHNHVFLNDNCLCAIPGALIFHDPLNFIANYKRPECKKI